MYYWRVRIRSAGQWGDWSPTWSFEIVTAPEIDVRQDSTAISSGGSFGFGNVVLGSGGSAIVFTVENLGTADLHLTGTPKVAVSGTGAGMFVVGAQPVSPIAPAGSSTFTITFTPTSAGPKTATVTIANDDLNENPYTITLTGTGITPEINVRKDTTVIPSSGSYGFGNVVLGSGGSAVVFTVENLGTADLHLEGAPEVAIGGADVGMFVVGAQPVSPIAPAGSSTFAITFTPTSAGPKTATVTIANDDLNENPYTITLTGTGVTPEINVKQGATAIPSGGSYGFGNVVLGSGGSAVVFTVENPGTADLHLTGTPKVAVSGTDAGMFVVGAQPVSPIAPAGSRTFTITFTPTSAGPKTATVTIANDDLNENPYTITLTGTGITPEIDVRQDSTAIPSGGSHSFGSLMVGSTSGAITFTIDNPGTADLHLTGTPKVAVSGTGAGMFVVGAQPVSPIAPAGSSTFTITFTPTSAGPKTATVTIANDDLNENPYTITLTGTGITPEINVRKDTTVIPSSGSYGFGNVVLGSGGSAVVFTVENLGTADLHLEGAPEVAIGGADVGMFVVGAQPVSPIAPAGSSTFTITFTPTSAGPKTATVTIANDDLNENPYTITLTGTGVTPEINVKQGATNLLDGTGIHAFGDILIGGSSGLITFTIQNVGTSNLQLTGTPRVEIFGTDAGLFVVGAQPVSPIVPAGSSTFTITFTPTSTGAKTATVIITNDDADENPYTFTLTGTAVTPEIDVRQDSTAIPSGGSHSFGSLMVGSTSGAITFTIDNPGTADLHLTGTPKVAVSGTDAGMFVVGAQPVSPIAPAGSRTFTITFTPTSAGPKTATVTIANDDLNENPYTITLTGTAVTPEIDVRQDSTAIPSGGSHSFGSLMVGSTSGAITFTIDNPGTADLHLTGTPKVAVSGTGAGMFVVGAQPVSPIAPAGSSTFTITFMPTSAGPKTATVTIANDDLNENPYTITLTGTGITPEINVRKDTTVIPSSGSYGFGNVVLGSGGLAVVFTVENLGTADLHLEGAPEVAIGGADVGMFVVGAQPVSPIAPAGSSTFTITFTPTSAGPKTATVTIANDDLNENPYTITLTGTGITPEIDVKQGATAIPSGGSYGFGNVVLGSGGSAVVFTVENPGTADLHLTGTPKVAVSGTDAGLFVVGAQPVSPIAPAGSRTFTITFTPTSAGPKTATVTIANDDLNENPYTITLTGTGITPEIDVRQDSTAIPSGGSHSFGSLMVGSTSGAITFTIDNPGTADLHLTGTPKVAVSGTNAGMFVVGAQPVSPIVPAGSRTFTITFTPTSAGPKTATVTIANDDLNENPYTITLTGTGITPEIDVRQDSTAIPSGGSHSFGSLMVGSTSGAITFTIDNPGTADLHLEGAPEVAIGGADAGMFVVGAQPVSPIAPAGSSTFTITFMPTSAGPKTATVTIANDDLNENPYTITLTGTGITPEINIRKDSTAIPSGGSYGFGSAKANTSLTPIVFTIENPGTAILNLTGSPPVEVGGADPNQFTVTSQPMATVDPSSSTTFTIIFEPTSEGLKNASISIASDDSDENPYVITVSGTGVVPDMNVKQGFANISSGSGSFDFGAVRSGTSGDQVTFVIENLGLADLLLTGSPRVSVGGTNDTMFVVGTQPASTVAPSGSATFTITFSPTSPGSKSAVVSIANDDPDEHPYTFALIGEGGTEPEINLFRGSTNIPSGDSYGFGDVLLGSGGSTVIFGVENLGTADLNLTGTPAVAIDGPDAGMFTVDAQPASLLAPDEYATFGIIFTPTSVGAKTATVTIASNDSDENPYVLTLTGTGIVAPEVNVKQDFTDIPSGTGSYGFGNADVGLPNAEIIFTIENLGNAALNLTGTPGVVIGGADASMFVVGTQPTTPVTPLGTTTFTITFTPTSAGAKTATVTIPNDDTDENPYTFNLAGYGIGPEIDVKQDGASIPSGTGTYDFGVVVVGASSVEVSFTVENLGTADLDLVGTPRVAVSGSDPTMFVVVSQPVSQVPPSGNAAFTIVFTPGNLGSKRATISIGNNDGDENPYTFAVKGRGISS